MLFMEQYLHLLIARSDEFTPGPVQLKAFLAAIISSGVIPKLESITFRTPSKNVRTGKNPFTGENVTIPMWDNKKISKIDDLENEANDIQDYEVEIVGCGTPKLPAVDIVSDGPYYVSIRCCI